MLQFRERVGYWQKDETNQWVWRMFTTKHKSKKDHGGKVHDCRPFMSDEDLKREILGNDSYNIIERS